MPSFFITLLNMSITASYLIAAVLLARLCLRRAPTLLSYLLWALVLFRLVCPVSIRSPLSVLPSVTAVEPSILTAQPPTVYTGLEFINSAVNPLLSEYMSPGNAQSSTTPILSTTEIAMAIWFVFIALMAAYGIVSYLRLHSRLRFATKAEDGAWESDRITMPMVLGILRPRIYLPAGLLQSERLYILEHERMHIRHGDHFIKFIAFLVLMLHSFNPFVWAAYLEMSRDMEMFCDESVIKHMGGNTRTAYSASLLSYSARRSGIVVPLAFSESNTASRIKNIINYRKPGFWAIAASAAVIVVLSVFLLTDPGSSLAPPSINNTGQPGNSNVGTIDSSNYGNITQTPSALPVFKSLTYYENGKQALHIARLDDAQAEALHTVFFYSLLSSSLGSKEPPENGDRFELAAEVNGQKQIYIAFPTGSGYAFGLKGSTFYSGISGSTYQQLVFVAEGGDTRNLSMSQNVVAFIELLLADPAYANAGFHAYACREITPGMGTEAYGKTPYKLFKFKDSCASFLLFENAIYPVGEWFGGLGLVQAIPYEDGLLFTYSWGSGMHRSHISYFNFAKKEMQALDYILPHYDTMLQSAAAQKGDASLSEFTICQADVTITGNDFTEISLAANRQIGQLSYKNGKFYITLYEEKAP